MERAIIWEFEDDGSGESTTCTIIVGSIPLKDFGKYQKLDADAVAAAKEYANDMMEEDGLDRAGPGETIDPKYASHLAAFRAWAEVLASTKAVFFDDMETTMEDLGWTDFRECLTMPGAFIIQAADVAKSVNPGVFAQGQRNFGVPVPKDLKAKAQKNKAGPGGSGRKKQLRAAQKDAEKAEN